MSWIINNKKAYYIKTELNYPSFNKGSRLRFFKKGAVAGASIIFNLFYLSNKKKNIIDNAYLSEDGN